MSMTLVNMASEVAKIIGGHNTSSLLDLATQAIKASLRDWQSAKEWNFLLKDTSATTAVSVTGINNTATILANGSIVATGGLDFVNVGQTVTYSGVAGTLAASTTVSSVTRGSDGVITQIVLSNALADIPTTENGTLTFSADIPIRANANEYNLPADFGSAYSARTTTTKRLLEYIKYREWNRKVVDQDTTGAVEAYTVYNPRSPLTQNYGTYRLRVFRTPSASDTLHLQYFRTINVDATTVDIPDEYINMLIDYAQWRFIRLKDTEDTRIPHLFEVAQASLARAMSDDEENTEDETIRLISQMEAWSGDRPLWGNGNFYPTMDF